MQILVVVPACGRTERTVQCIDTMMPTIPEGVRVAVLESGSGRVPDDVMARWKKDYGRDLYYTYSSGTITKSQALNHCLLQSQQVRPEYVVSVDNDMVFLDSGWFHAICCNPTSSRLRVTAVKLLEPDKDNKPLDIEFMPVRRVQADSPEEAMQFARGKQPGKYTEEIWTYTRHDYVAGGIIAIPWRVIEAVGYWYEPLGTWGTDQEWCARAWNAGVEFWYWDPGARIAHEPEGEGYPARDKNYNRAKTQIRKKNAKLLEDRLDQVWKEGLTWWAPSRLAPDPQGPPPQ